MPVIATGLDYSARRLTGKQVRAAGYAFVNRYLWFPGQGHAYLTAAEYQDLRVNGVEVHAIYEQNTSDPAGGWNAGVSMARQAVQSAQAAGLPPGSVIFMCADGWLATHGIPVATAMRFLDGARSVIDPAGYVLGAYGFADFIYAAQDGEHADVLWLCGAESGVRPGIHMYQWNNGRVYVDGLECDLNKQYEPIGEDMPTAQEIARAILDVWLEDKREGVPDGERHPTPVSNALWSTWHTIHYGDESRPGVAGLYPSQRDIVAAVKAGSGADAETQARLVADQVVALLRVAIREELGDDNAEQADAIVDRLAERLRASLTADVENGPTEADTVG